MTMVHQVGRRFLVNKLIMSHCYNVILINLVRFRPTTALIASLVIDKSYCNLGIIMYVLGYLGYEQFNKLSIPGVPNEFFHLICVHF